MSAEIGVLALQGDVAEHEDALRGLGATPWRVLAAADLRGLNGLVIPGGESTTIGKLAVDYGLIEPLREFVASGKPVLGTCAGLILLADDVGRDQPLVGGLDISVERNAFGRQVDSFESNVRLAGDDDSPFKGVFIRSPLVTAVGPAAEVFARLEDGSVVGVRQGNVVGVSFHPELTGDPRVHQLALADALPPS
ncbi:MAG: pyridoxal 5'-phosphate synthase glutaminase subunit PdxT [Anaerolineae bacterium]